MSNIKNIICESRKDIPVSYGRSFFGCDITHKPVYIEWAETPVWSVIGVSGSGRTNCMFPLYVELASNYETYVIDGKTQGSVLPALTPEATLIPLSEANDFLDRMANPPYEKGNPIFIIINLPQSIEYQHPGFCQKINYLARFARAKNITIFLADTNTSHELKQFQNFNSPAGKIIFPYHFTEKLENTPYEDHVPFYRNTRNIVFARLSSTHTEPTIIYPHNPVIPDTCIIPWYNRPQETQPILSTESYIHEVSPRNKKTLHKILTTIKP